MIARATAPNAVGPGSVFPDAAKWDFADGLSGMSNLQLLLNSTDQFRAGSPMALPLFWIALICQLVIVLGYFWFYRKEQLGMLLSCISNATQLKSAFLQHDHKKSSFNHSFFRARTRGGLIYGLHIHSLNGLVIYGICRTC